MTVVSSTLGIGDNGLDFRVMSLSTALVTVTEIVSLEDQGQRPPEVLESNTLQNTGLQILIL